MASEDGPPLEFVCPISQEVMQDPVIDCQGHSYERTAISAWYAGHDRSPVAGVCLTDAERRILIPNRALKNQIEAWLEKNPQARADNAQDDTTPNADQQRRAHTASAPAAPEPVRHTAREVSFHDAQRHEMHWLGRRWYRALPASTREQWDALQLGTTCRVEDFMELMGDDFGDHRQLFIKALGDLDGDGVLTPDEMHALLYIAANYKVCGICQGPIVMLHGATCFSCTREPLLANGAGRAWVCNECVEEGGGRDPRWGAPCPVTGERHAVAELMDIRSAIQLKLLCGEDDEASDLQPLTTFPDLDLNAVAERVHSTRRARMLDYALGLVLDVEFEDEEGWTPLHVAALYGDSDAIRFLVLQADKPEEYARKVMRTLRTLGAEIDASRRELDAARQDIQDAVDEHSRHQDEELAG